MRVVEAAAEAVGVEKAVFGASSVRMPSRWVAERQGCDGSVAWRHCVGGPCSI